MKVLIDTNILIPLEDTGRELDPALARFKRVCSSRNFRILLHPAQREDIARDQNAERRQIVLSRTEQYHEIESPPTITEIERDQLGWREISENDRIDNLLLQAVRRGAAHVLVTEDQLLHRKARSAGLSDSVFRLYQFLAAFTETTSGHPIAPPGIEPRHLHEFDVSQPFFDSLREGYPDFDAWYLAKAREDRRAWSVTAHGDRSMLEAICIHKEEEGISECEGVLALVGKALKLCTFKVSQAARGRKLGERLLYTSFSHALKVGAEWVFLHTRGSEQEMLIGLLEEYGFKKHGTYRGDEVYVKAMAPSRSDPITDPFSYSVQYYPHFLITENVKKFLVPIQPQFHERLFVDISDFSHSLFGAEQLMYEAPSNTIKKAYLCRSSVRTVGRGDILLFYRSTDRQSIEAIGICETAFWSTDDAEVLAATSKRTVYSDHDVRSFSRAGVLVILFRLQKYLRHPITSAQLKNAGVRGPIQQIRQITNNTFREIYLE